MPKLTVEFGNEAHQLLEELAAKGDTTKIGVLRRALALYSYVEEETRKNPNRRLAIAEDEHVIKEIVL